MCSPVLVLKEEPYALAVTGECFNKVCNGCLRMPENDNPLGRCSGCRVLLYCNYDCAVKDWKRGVDNKKVHENQRSSGHRYECGVFTEMRKKREKTSKDGCWQLAKIKKNFRLRLTARLLGCVAQNNGYPGTGHNSLCRPSFSHLDAVCLTKTNMRCSFWSNEPASGLPHEEKYIEDLELFQQSYKLFSERFAKVIIGLFYLDVFICRLPMKSFCALPVMAPLSSPFLMILC